MSTPSPGLCCRGMAVGTHRWVLLRHGESPVKGRRFRKTVPARMPARRRDHIPLRLSCWRGSPACPKGMWSAARELIDGVSRTVPGSPLLLPRSSPVLDRLSQRALTFATRVNRPRSFFY
ncbi:hypothetical protein SRU_p0022 (plasmid) [Salinibacter ruber DSM 13855]|uniref:Uncharacterized protein n=1 Tax=Salinibacter ruber (strain DSM 13855 / M31) TaxID=309807 RepID=Q2RYK1_SALRD|nr:hypothetical protein SRU_p0022 [Salinibacter ruber DSM 13855]